MASFHQDHLYVRFHPVGCLELCSPSPASLFASASVSPHERRTHTVFCSVVPWFVKGLRCSSLAVVMALHEPLTMALHGSPASLSDELFARPRADPRVLFPHASSRAARGCVWFGCTQHHSLPSPPRAARVEGVVFRLVVNSAMPCLWPLFTRRREHLVAGACASKVCIANGELHLSSGLALLGFPRSSTVVLSSPSARVCSEHLRVGRSWFAAMVWLSSLRPPGSTPAEA